jgi:hypothetical protein
MEALSPASTPFDYLYRHHPLGWSTGWFVEERGDWPALVARALAGSTFAVELSALAAGELPSLVTYLQREPTLPFRYVSVHGPAQGWQGTADELAGLLREISTRADAVVMHPDSLADAEPYQALGRALALENMDPRKDDGRTKHELERHFERFPDAGFIFDVAHANAVDPTLELAHALLDAFGHRLRHVHVSSLDAECRHVPLSPGDAASFAPVLTRCRGVPWLLEAPLADADSWMRSSA